MKRELTYHQKIKLEKGLCVEPRCDRKHALKRTICQYHKKLKWIQAHPERYTFCNLRTNARRRGKICTLTFEEFMFFLKQNPDYMKKKGRTVKALQIDCIQNDLGYTKENIRCIQMRENRYKQNAVDYQTSDPTAENYCGF